MNRQVPLSLDTSQAPPSLPLPHLPHPPLCPSLTRLKGILISSYEHLGAIFLLTDTSGICVIWLGQPTFICTHLFLSVSSQGQVSRPVILYIKQCSLGYFMKLWPYPSPRFLLLFIYFPLNVMSVCAKVLSSTHAFAQIHFPPSVCERYFSQLDMILGTQTWAWLSPALDYTPSEGGQLRQSYLTNGRLIRCTHTYGHLIALRLQKVKKPEKFRLLKLDLLV